MSVPNTHRARLCGKVAHTHRANGTDGEDGGEGGRGIWCVTNSASVPPAAETAPGVPERNGMGTAASAAEKTGAADVGTIERGECGRWAGLEDGCTGTGKANGTLHSVGSFGIE